MQLTGLVDTLFPMHLHLTVILLPSRVNYQFDWSISQCICFGKSVSTNPSLPYHKWWNSIIFYEIVNYIVIVNTLYLISTSGTWYSWWTFHWIQPQCSTHGQRLQEHCPRFPCRDILQCWWSPYEMSDEKTGSLVHTLFIQGCPGSFTYLSIEHWVQGTL